ncbi:CopG family transcriptional regulator [Deinococcus koreensis]|uniref:CopG family transcriptional regulator n=1 Tax=Deinococcus koreensis TaxID=2054903 RepID=A0A2K3US08_9DEIO|nr:CopG family transcriptional regulator [Deinococcus koreensis]
MKRTDVPREQLNVRIRPELKRAAAGLAGLEGMTLGDVVEAALIDYIRQHQGDEKS